MQKLSRPLLKPNPFTSLRDPETGKWRVIFRLPRDNRVEISEERSVTQPMSVQVEYSR